MGKLLVRTRDAPSVWQEVKSVSLGSIKTPSNVLEFSYYGDVE